MNNKYIYLIVGCLTAVAHVTVEAKQTIIKVSQFPTSGQVTSTPVSHNTDDEPESKKAIVIQRDSGGYSAEYVQEKHTTPRKDGELPTTERTWLERWFGDEPKPTPVPPEPPGKLTSIESILVKDIKPLNPETDIAASKTSWEQHMQKTTPKMIKSPYVFFNTKPPAALSDRMYIDEREGKIYFKVVRGTLQNNLRSLMKDTRNTKHLIWKVGAHRVYSDYWVSGSSMFELVNNLVAPYNQPSQVMFGIFLGQAIGVFYDEDKEFWL